MLILARGVGEEIVISDDIVIRVLDIRYGKVRLGITAPRVITIHRREIYERLRAAGGALTVPNAELPSWKTPDLGSPAGPPGESLLLPPR